MSLGLPTSYTAAATQPSASTGWYRIAAARSPLPVCACSCAKSSCSAALEPCSCRPLRISHPASVAKKRCTSMVLPVNAVLTLHM